MIQTKLASSKVEVPRARKYKKHSKFAEIWKQMHKNVGAMVGLVIIVILAFAVMFSDVMFDYDTDIIGTYPSERLQTPSLEHLMGTDDLGRDVFNRLVYGAKYSLSIGIAAVCLALLAGLILGATAGYYGGTLDIVIMRIVDIFSAVPTILLGTAIVSALGPSMLNLLIAMGIASTPVFVRITRASVFTICNQEYVESARAIGLPELKIITSHVLPNCLSPIIVQTTLKIASTIVAASGLSFLGLGVPEPTPEWGSMLSTGRAFIRSYSYLTIFPGLAIMITVLAFNLLGDGLRDALDPKLRK